jgi:hypothetical protein
MTDVTAAGGGGWPEAAQGRIAQVVREAVRRTVGGRDARAGVPWVDGAPPRPPHRPAAASAPAICLGQQQAWLDGLVPPADRSPDASTRGCRARHRAFLERMGPGGGQMVYDAVAHEHDLRAALGVPGGRDSSGVLACATAASMLLARDLAAHGLPAVRVTSNGRTWDVGEGPAELAVELDPFELIRVLGSRRSEAQLRRLPWQGDLDRYLPVSHMPLPIATWSVSSENRPIGLVVNPRSGNDVRGSSPAPAVGARGQDLDRAAHRARRRLGATSFVTNHERTRWCVAPPGPAWHHGRQDRRADRNTEHDTTRW